MKFAIRHNVTRELQPVGQPIVLHLKAILGVLDKVKQSLFHKGSNFLSKFTNLITSVYVLGNFFIQNVRLRGKL